MRRRKKRRGEGVEIEGRRPKAGVGIICRRETSGG